MEKLRAGVFLGINVKLLKIILFTWKKNTAVKWRLYSATEKQLTIESKWWNNDITSCRYIRMENF